MALIDSAATGNFNAGATWVGGVVPTVGDTARVVSGHVVTINVNTACDAVTNANSTGYFVLPDGITLTAAVTGGSAQTDNATLRYSGTTSATIVGNITASQNTSSAITIRHTGTAGTLNITGTVSNTSTSNSVTAIRLAANGTVAVTGDINGPTATSNTSVSLVGAGTLTVTGNVYGGNGSSSISGTTSGAVVTINGDVYGTTAINSTNTVNVHTVTVNGNLFGGTPIATNNAVAVNATISTINGNVSAGTTSAANGSTFGLTCAGSISSSNNEGRHIVNGNIYAANNCPAISIGANAALVVNGDMFDAASGRMAVGGSGTLRIINTSSYFHSVRSGSITFSGPNLVNGTEVVLIDEDLITPPASDVRAGVVYAAGSATGTCAVPPAGSVSLGVPVDNTTGTSVVTAADFATLVGAQIVAAVSAP